MSPNRAVTVFGAYGHTGRFVVEELCQRGWAPVLSGRDAARLRAMQATYPHLQMRVADVQEPRLLDAALHNSDLIINCAGPFIDTVIPVIEAAIRSGVHYLDVAAEQRAVLTVFERFAEPAREAGVVVIPAMAFYGGLGDLMAAAAMGDWDSADEIAIAVALDSWYPTRGSRLTGERHAGQRRFYFSRSALEQADAPANRTWNFPAPFGSLEVVPYPLAETITISRHLRAPEIRMYVNASAVADENNPDTPLPVPADESGRSSQIFLMDVIVRARGEQRRLIASGRDIYAASAPIVAEAAERIAAGLARGNGVLAAADAFDAWEFLQSLHHIAVSGHQATHA